jgi:hypothetical protein
LRFHGIQRLDRPAFGSSDGWSPDAAEDFPLAVALSAAFPEGWLEAMGSAAFRFQGIQLRPVDGSDSTGSAADFVFSVGEFLLVSDEVVLLLAPSPAAGAGAAGFLATAFAVEAAAGDPLEEVDGALLLMESLAD